MRPRHCERHITTLTITSAAPNEGVGLLILEVAVVLLLIGIVASHRRKTEMTAKVPGYICRNCGNAVSPIEASKLNGCFLIVLLLCFLVPGILYLVWAGTQTVRTCPRCNAQNNFV